MTIALISVFFLIFLVAINVLSIKGQSKCCPAERFCDDSCKAPPAINISLALVLADQPLFVTFLPKTSLFAGIDNSCFILIPLPDGNFLLTVSTVFIIGTSAEESFIISSKVPGVGDYGYCTMQPEHVIPIIGFSPFNVTISEDCLTSAKDLIARSGLPSQDYYILPMERSLQCVTQLPCPLE